MEDQESWKRFLQTYYVVNALSILSYVPLRLSARNLGTLERRDEYLGLTWETQVVVTFLLYMVPRYRQAASLEGFWTSCFFYGKVGVLCLAFMMSQAVFGWYVVIFAVLVIVVQPPAFEWSPVIKGIGANSMEAELKGKARLLVIFHAPWHQVCVDLIPTFSKLAKQYGDNNLRFGKVDVSVNAELAKEFQIDTSVWTNHLPTLILFKDGKEVSRLPQLESQGTVKFTVQTIANYFELENKKKT